MTTHEENGTVNEHSDVAPIMNDSTGSSGGKSIEAILESEDFKEEVKLLVNSEIKSGGKPISALQQLSDLLTQHSKINMPAQQRGNVPTIPINDIRGDDSTGYSKEEKQVRCNLAALYRLVDMHGWAHGIYNHITVRVSNGQDHFLIQPFGLLYHEVTASSLIKINHHGDVVDRGSTVLGVNKAGWLLHSALHAAREDVNCVVHLHVPDVVAVSCMKEGLLPSSCEALTVLEAGVAYHDYSGILVDDAEKQSLAHDLGDTAKVLFLRNHGFVTCAESVAEAWRLTKMVVTACQTQMRMIQLGGDSVLSSSSAHFRLASPYRQSSPAHAHPGGDSSGLTDAADLEFEAMMRLLDSAGYRTGYTYRQPNLLRRHGTGGLPIMGEEVEELQHYEYAEDGKEHVARIVNQVRTNRAKAAQRTEWLAKTTADGSLDREDKHGS